MVGLSPEDVWVREAVAVCELVDVLSRQSTVRIHELRVPERARHVIGACQIHIVHTYSTLMSHPYGTSGGCWVRLHTYNEGFLGIFEAQSQTQHLIVLPRHPTQIQVRQGQCMYVCMYVCMYKCMYVCMYI